MASDPLIFVGSGPRGGMVSVFQADGTPVVSVPPFGGGFTGGVRVAAGDINGDGITDVVAGMASGGGQVRAFNGLDGTTLGTSTPFGAGFTGGVFVATGDVNADGHDDILLGAGQGSGLARLIDGATQTELGSGLPARRATSRRRPPASRVANGGFSLSNIFLQSNCLTVCNTLRADVRGNTVPAVAPNGELIAAQLALIETGASTLELVDTGAASGSCTAQLTENNTGSAAATAGCALIPGPISTPP